MEKALIFQNGEPVIVTAEEVKNGKYPPSEYEFVDPEYRFRVQFVRSAKNKGGPYFRLYYSYEDYKKLFPDKVDRYQIVANMRRFQECKWHREWKKAVSGFCEIEKCFYNRDTRRHKFADAYCPETNTCIEFQHSYIAMDFEERNKFYSALGIPVIWLYDLPKAHICKREDGYYEILEDNARGFFRISEDPANLKKYLVFIQVKSKMIYRVEELKRLDTGTERKSTIRYFKPTEVYTEEDFIKAIRSNLIRPPAIQPYPMSIPTLWRNNFRSLYIRDTENDNIYMINTDGNGHIFRNQYGCIIYQFASYIGTRLVPRIGYEYPLSKNEEHLRKWSALQYRI